MLERKLSAFDSTLSHGLVFCSKYHRFPHLCFLRIEDCQSCAATLHASTCVWLWIFRNQNHYLAEPQPEPQFWPGRMLEGRAATFKTLLLQHRATNEQWQRNDPRGLGKCKCTKRWCVGSKMDNCTPDGGHNVNAATRCVVNISVVHR